MSYILEALKKAQAQRQLGAAPTIHTLPVHVGANAAAGARGALVWIGVASAALVAATAAVFVWHDSGTAAPSSNAVPAAVAAAAPSAPALSRPSVAASAPRSSGGIANSPAARPPASALAPLPARAIASQFASVTATPRAAAAARAETAHRQAIAPAPAPLPAPDAAPTLRELPDAIQREIPALAIGGYIYSANPDDRLLLIDKVLRHEGEEVAPGLILERLLPKAALMNYKGYRYRVAY